ncbi:MAG: TfoX/Sxy family protein [Planctomycetaceae bacterium]|nr:TfoX/Sxy family protein [Planctomycetaceae bacterium]
MPYSKQLAERVRMALGRRPGLVEKRMFGGVCLLLRGNMLVGVWEQLLIARLGPDEAARALKEPNVREFDVTGRPMRGWVMIEPDGLDRDADLAQWLARAEAFVETLPAK